MSKKPRKPPGPEADRLKLDDPDWKANVQKALRTPSPPEGWPKSGPKPRRRKT